MLLTVFGNAQRIKSETITQLIGKYIAKEKLQIEFDITSSSKNELGVLHVYGIQTYLNNPIIGTEFNFAIANDEVIYFHHNFLLKPESYNKINVYSLNEANALQILVGDYPINKAEVQPINGHTYNYVNQKISDEPIVIYKKWYLVDAELIPVYEVSLYEKDHSHWYNTIINATKFEILEKIDWVVSCNTTALKYAHATTDLPLDPSKTEVNKQNATSGYRVFAMPLESPKHGNRTLEIDPENTNASPFGWHDVNGATGAEYTITRGNNVLASEDKNDSDVPGYSPNGGSNLVFDYDFDITKSAALYTDAAITNLFYWNNIMHDVWWHYGFDEQSGNFQQNNYNNGGAGSDFVNADAQDGSGTNNANFATPPDGQNPRMQMYLWSSTRAGDHFQVNSPAFASGKYESSTAAFGTQLSKTPITANLVVANSGGTNSKRGCSAFLNAAQVNGKIAYIERGTCTFVEKVKNAQNAGAIGVVIYDSTSNSPINLGGTDNSITIPSIMIRKNDGQYLLGVLSSQAVSVSLYDSSVSGAVILDSDFDNGVIAHEYGHGISNRLTGGASNTSCLTNEEQMGEGWSDFFALVMTHKSGDKGSDARGIGTYVSNDDITSSGIRNYPYSTNITNSPYSYENIKTFSVPHGVGSVWCAMLWDMYWLFIDEYGYDSDIYDGTGGNNMAMQLVIDAMKLQPCGPGFVDGRDALLLADKLRYSGNNQKLIWNAFARRGLGFDASQGSSNSRSDGTSAFNIPPYLNGELFISKKTLSQSNNNEELTYKITLTNYNNYTINNIQLLDTLPPNVSLVEGSLSCVVNVQNNILLFKIDSLMGGDSFVCTYKIIPKLSEVSTILWLDNVENGEKNWIKGANKGNNGFLISNTRKNSGSNSWFVANEAVATDYNLQISVQVSGTNPALSLKHFYNTEALWDGGVVEYKTEAGAWEDAGSLFIFNGYNSQISVNPESSLSGRKGFTGSSNSFITSLIDLSGFVGSKIDIRFRFASDGAEAADGWYLDDISFENLVSIKNNVYCEYADDKNVEASAVTFIYGENSGASVSNLASDELIEIYPNPTNDLLYISTKSKDLMSLKLFDINGKLLQKTQKEGSMILDLRDYSSGLYMLEIRKDGEVKRVKIVKD